MYIVLVLFRPSVKKSLGHSTGSISVNFLLHYGKTKNLPLEKTLWSEMKK